MSDFLKQFYRDYRDWLLADAPVKNKFDFTRSSGLCANLHSYVCLHGIMRDLSFMVEMEQQFADAGLRDLIPFNRTKEGDVSYRNESEESTCHLNKKRIAWVEEHAK